MKLKITEAGVYDAEGKRIPVGEEITVKGDSVPAWLVGKAVEIQTRKVLVTNPAKGALQEKAD